MEDNIQLFEHEEFGKVRVVMIDGEPWLVGKDVATALGYKDTFAALKQHVDDEDKQNWQNTSFASPRGLIVINESGFYSLVFSSELESAKKFKRWVTHEVLPSIRKTGSYSVTKNDSDSDSFAKAVLKLADAISELVDVEREKLAFGCERLALGRERFAFEQKKFDVANSENAKIFEVAQELRKLASESDERYICSKLVRLATNLLMGENFITNSYGTFFKKFQ